jgi:hypothetical protein
MLRLLTTSKRKTLLFTIAALVISLSEHEEQFHWKLPQIQFKV